MSPAEFVQRRSALRLGVELLRIANQAATGDPRGVPTPEIHQAAREVAQGYGEGQWEALARLAGVPAPDEATRARVLRSLGPVEHVPLTTAQPGVLSPYRIAGVGG